jgi:hypothetical protein
MKPHPHLLLIPLAAAVLCGASLPVRAAPFKSAEVTRVYNDVRIVQKDSPAVPAKTGDSVQGETRLATGDESRAELRFPDNSLTRLGANSVFRLEAGNRTVELERGVMLLQVPKQIGGAKVRTAAVTAAVTGTTILVEYLPDGHIKIIVVEGEVDLFFNDKPADFITLRQGEMLIMKTNAKSFPDPVTVDLERLLATSLLMDLKVFDALGNQRELERALKEQADLKEKGELLTSAFVIEGLGTRVALTRELRKQLERGSPAVEPVASGKPPPGRVPNGPVFVPPVSYVDNNTELSTNPSVSVFNDPGGFALIQGQIYEPAKEGPVRGVLFGAPPGPTETQQRFDERGPWAAFTFFDLVIAGNPDIDSSSGPRNLILASQTGVNFSNSNVPPELSTGGALYLDPALDALSVLAATGNIVIHPGFGIAGNMQFLLLDAFGPESDVQVLGEIESSASIELDDGIAQINAQRDELWDMASVFSGHVGIQAGQDVTITDSFITAGHSGKVVAGRNLTLTASSFLVTNSSDLGLLTQADIGQLLLFAQNGSVTVDDAFLSALEVRIEAQTGDITLLNATTIQADILKARTLSPNGILTIGGTSDLSATGLIRLYAEGANGRVHFTGPATLNAAQIDLAGATVRVDAGVDVNVTQPAQFRVYTDNPQFSNNVSNGYGRFTSGGNPFPVQGGAFADRPAY